MTRPLGWLAIGFAFVAACTTVTAPEPTNPLPSTSMAESPVPDPDQAGATAPTATTPTTQSSMTTSSSVDPAQGTSVGACWDAEREGSPGAVDLVDVTEELGLIQPLAGMHGHAAAVGDADVDGDPDLVVGTFADRPTDTYRHRGASGPAPDRLLLQRSGGFETSRGFPEARGRTSGAVMADLDLDGDLDLVLSRNPREGTRRELPSMIYRNDNGRFVPVPEAGIPSDLGGRSIGVLRIDGDELPDLFIAEDRWQGGSSVALRNLGGLRFEQATGSLGLPDDVHGLGVATGDLDRDGITDLVVGGSNRVFLGTGTGLSEVSVPELAWEVYGEEDDVAGVAMADLNRDGWLDLVIGHHYNSTLEFDRRVPVRVYLNRTSTRGGELRFQDITADAGMTPLPTKAPHVQVADLDNDGWPDIVTSASVGDGSTPLIFRHRGLENGIPVFEAVGEPGPAQYWVSAPVADFDRDGRLDIFLLEWEPSLPSRLLANRGDTGHWISVSIEAGWGGGPGTRVDVYRAGAGGSPTARLGAQDISTSVGYSAGVEAHAHFGLGGETAVDLVVTPPGSEPILVPGVAADQHLRLPGGC